MVIFHSYVNVYKRVVYDIQQTNNGCHQRGDHPWGVLGFHGSVLWVPYDGGFMAPFQELQDERQEKTL
jgi:hypothetical protein